MRPFIIIRSASFYFAIPIIRKPDRFHLLRESFTALEDSAKSVPWWQVEKILQNEKNSEYQKLNLETQVESAYQTWKNQYDQYFELKATDLENLETVYNGILKNFRNGNVSLIEFTDFMESYRQTVLQVYEMKKQIMISAEQLNLLVQTKIFY